MGPIVSLLLSLVLLGLLVRLAYRPAGATSLVASTCHRLARALRPRDLGLVALGAAAAFAWSELGGLTEPRDPHGTAAIAALAALNAQDAAGPVPAAPATADQPAGLASVDDMIETLVERLKREPKNAEGWRMLGWSYAQTDRPGDAAKAYAEAISLAPERADFHAAYAEALVNATGRLNDPARAAIDKALSLDPSEARALDLKRRFAGAD